MINWYCETLFNSGKDKYLSYINNNYNKKYIKCMDMKNYYMILKI